jgi:AraC family transcriptional regulator of adaptative response / DNA-3-methyladenine glycosylase II
MKDNLLKKSVTKNPGLRVPGAFDGFEMAIRAILGQQITVKAATTITGRFAEAFGEKIRTPFPELTRLSPLATRIAKLSVRDIAKLGIVRTRAASILALARAFHAGSLKLDAGTNPEADIAQLIALPGIGQWTAHYIAMRASRWPDAFPKEDIAVRNSLGGVSAKKAEEISQAWRPWRSYAVMYIWKNPGNRSRSNRSGSRRAPVPVTNKNIRKIERIRSKRKDRVKSKHNVFESDQPSLRPRLGQRVISDQ